jgi:hypothetical protein
MFCSSAVDTAFGLPGNDPKRSAAILCEALARSASSTANQYRCGFI